MYFGSTSRPRSGGRICRVAASAVPSGPAARSANHTSQLPEKLVTLGIWMAMAYTTRPANLASGASATRGALGSTGTFGAAPIAPRAAASRFAFEVGENGAISVGCVSLAPPFTTSPGTFSRAMPLAPVPPSARGSGPAEKPAACEAGGAGTSVVFAGFSPTMASDASAVVPATPATTGGSTGIPPWGPERFLSAAFTLGASGSPAAAVTGRDFVGGATNAFGSGLGPAPGNGSAF